ncbi:sigma-70 family RNA polymerase sigma factor [Maioricimonas sp. JC845]|uniref:RNA polymerase sigma factor n=1 Tax=Maioricimonas sp. JC845 TaxID=3232138 RepID=UPI003458704B
MSDETSVNLYHRYRAGDSDAANDIFRRYVDRLVGLVRNRMSRPIQRRIDPEDIVQSAWRAFFDKATSGEFEIRQEGDLWSLLAAIAVKKMLSQVRYHRAAKRTVDRDGEGRGSGLKVLSESLDAGGPPPEQATMFFEELDAFMVTLDPTQRKVLGLRLQDWSNEQIAREIGRSTRTVRRTLEEIHLALLERLQ